MQRAELKRLTLPEIVRRAGRSLQFRQAERKWRAAQKRFAAAGPENYRRDFSPETLPGVHVHSFSGARDLSMQALSILSFLRHVGIPERWTVVSDDSHTPDHQKHLTAIHPYVVVKSWRDYLTPENRESIEPYARDYPLGKKLALLTALPQPGPAVYLDSDILFFAGGARLRKLLAESNANHFLRDIGNVVVPGLATAEEQALPLLNSGFLIQNKPIPWAEPLARLARGAWRGQKWESSVTIQHFLEQTVAHIGYHASGARMLDPKHYVIDLSDAFDPRDRFSGPDIVLRHYICHARLKLWSHARDYLK